MDLTVSDLIRDGQEQYDEEIAGCGKWELFYHLSSLRRAALAWYPVPEGAAVLEAGCGCGAMTGALLEKAGRVDAVDIDPERVRLTGLRYSRRKNLRLFAQDIRLFTPDRKYDLIILIEFFETFEGDVQELFERLSGFLAPGGVILAGFRNRFGFKYQCGALDEYVREPGGALDPAVPFHTKEEMDQAARGAGLKEIRYFYPMPDFGFTQDVYSDEWPAPATVRDRVLPYDPFGDGSAARARREYEGYDDLIAAGLFPACSNVILMEMRKSKAGDDPERVIGAVLSADREKDRAYVTRIRARRGSAHPDSVLKSALHPAGAGRLEETRASLEKMRAAGLETVPCRYVNGRDAAEGIVMPYVNDRLLIEEIRRALRRGPERVFDLFGELERDIKRSMEGTGLNNTAPHEAYIDMIPNNAFYRDGKIVYFDQEFTVPDCPASYVLYRAVRYTWLHIREAQSVIPLERMKECFGLTDLWDEYTRREDAFTDRNRNRRLYADIYRWAWGEKSYGTGFVMGVFDLLHEGHLNLFRRAKERCAYLRVGILSDELVRFYKGISPVNSQQERLALVSAVSQVDEVVLVDGAYVSKVAEWHKRPYDCFFSGDDHADNPYWEKERKELAALGAKMEFFPYTQSVSSTMLRAKLREDGQEEDNRG